MKNRQQATSLDFLNNIPRKGMSLTVEQAKEILSTYQQTGYKVQATAEHLKVRLGMVTAIITELKKAARQGYTLESYFEENRPFATWKKKLEEKAGNLVQQ